MTRSRLLTGALAAVLLVPAAASFAAPRGGGGMASPMMSSPMTHTMTTTATTAATPVAQGQPNQSCQAAGSATPGNAGSPSNTGSPFSPNGISGSRYAGSQPQNSNNPASVAQYDVACTKGGR